MVKKFRTRLGIGFSRCVVWFLMLPLAGAQTAYVTNENDDTVSVINTASRMVVATVKVGAVPSAIAVTPDGTRAYVTNENDNTVSVIDTSNDIVVHTISVGNEPLGVAIIPEGSRAYVTNGGDNTVSVIDTASNNIVATIAVNKMPWGIVITPDGTRAYVANVMDGNISVIDTASNNIVATIGILTLWGMAFTPDGTRAYVTTEDGVVSVINTATQTVVDTIEPGSGPDAVAVTPDGKWAYVVNGNDSTVSVINTPSNKVATIVPLGFPLDHLSPVTVAITPDGTAAYVVNSQSANVTVIDTSTNMPVTDIHVGALPWGLAFARVAPPPGNPPPAPANCSVMIVVCGNAATLVCDPVPLPNSLVLETCKNCTSQTPPSFHGVGVTPPMQPNGSNIVYDAPIDPGDNEFEACDVDPYFQRSCVWPVASFGPNLSGCSGHPSPPPVQPGQCQKAGCRINPNGGCLCQ